MRYKVRIAVDQGHLRGPEGLLSNEVTEVALVSYRVTKSSQKVTRVGTPSLPVRIGQVS